LLLAFLSSTDFSKRVATRARHLLSVSSFIPRLASTPKLCSSQPCTLRPPAMHAHPTSPPTPHCSSRIYQPSFRSFILSFVIPCRAKCARLCAAPFTRLFPVSYSTLFLTASAYPPNLMQRRARIFCLYANQPSTVSPLALVCVPHSSGPAGYQRKA
jgi:hypothetical protein